MIRRAASGIPTEMGTASPCMGHVERRRYARLRRQTSGARVMTCEQWRKRYPHDLSDKEMAESTAICEAPIRNAVGAEVGLARVD
jgi:hypothetical protein